MSKGKFFWNMLKGVPQVGNKLLGAAGKNSTLGNALGLKAGSTSKNIVGRTAQKAMRGTIRATPGVLGTGAVYGVAGQFLPDGGPDENEMAERAYNQIAYGVDMTNEQMQEAAEKGQEFKETGMIGEGGLDPEQVKAYITQESRDKLGEGPLGWASVAAQKGLGAMEWLGGLVGGGVATGTNAYFDGKLGQARNQELQNIVTKLKQDHNERAIRANREDTMGKAMTDGLLGSEFGSGRVTQIKKGGIVKADDPKQIAALKEYNKIKAEKGVGYAIKSEHAKLAGQQVYQDIADLIPSEGVDPAARRSAMENLLNQAGIMDTDTYMKNATGKTLTEMTTAQAEVDKTAATQAAEAAAKQTAAEAERTPQAVAQAEFVRDSNRSGPIDLPDAKDQQGVINNQAAIAQHRGFYGQAPEAVKQQAYLNANNMKTARQFEDGLQNDPRWADLMNRHMAKMSAQAKARSEYIAPQHRMGVDPNGQAARDKEAARIFGGNPAPVPTPSVPAQVNAAADGIGPDKVVPTPIKVPSGGVREGPPPLPPQRMPAPEPAPSNVMKPTPYGVGTATPGFPKLPDIGAPVRNFVENATTIKNSPGAPMPGMKPTPYGLGTGTPGMPQLPDIGGPARNAGERIGNLIFGTNAPGNPAPNMKPTPYGLGSGTAGMPQVPDIGAPVRNAVEGALTTQSSAPGQMPKGPMNQAEIAKLIAEQKRKEIEARNAQMPRNPGKTRPNPMKPLY
jgi:hypothetical protein